MGTPPALSALQAAARRLRPVAFGVVMSATLLASDSPEARAQGLDAFRDLPSMARAEVTTALPSPLPEDPDEGRDEDVEVYERCGLDEEGFFLDGVEPDSLLEPAHIQCGLQGLWEDSHPDDIYKKQEQAAYLVERDGRLELIRASTTSKCRADYDPHDVPNPSKIRAFIHTHPHKPFDPRPRERECVGTRVGPVEYGHGPSVPDVKLARRMHIPNFIIEELHVFRLPPFYGDRRYGTDDRITKVRRSR